MATPSSSATSASPPMSYLQANSPMTTSSSVPIMDSIDRNEPSQAVQKFLARAEIAMVTRGLRARLSYASFKAIHNVPHIPIHDLEVQLHPQSTTITRTGASKRKAGGANNYYNNPATQGAPSHRKGAMAPPSSRSSHYNSTAANNRSSNATQSLFTTLLAPPPAKQARTILNPSDPPLPPPSRPNAVPRSRRTSRPASDKASTSHARSGRSMAESTRAQAKTRRESGKATSRRNVKGKDKQRSIPQNVIASGEDDMKAAATLTSLLLHSRPSVAGTSSPRSSVSAGSDTGSVHSHPHFAQSSARTISTAVSSAETSFSANTPATNNVVRSMTPPPHPGAAVQSGITPTPPAHAPTDNEAADLMLYLATSPSPARPTTVKEKNARDLAAYRALGGGTGLRAKGRVLFPGSDKGEATNRTLSRVNDSSFGSTVSDLALSDGSKSFSQPSRLSITATLPALENGDNSTFGTSVGAQQKRSAMTPAQLLPPLLSPPNKPFEQPSPPPPSSSPWPSSASYISSDSRHLQAPPTPGNASFNFNEFINVSPSPAAGSNSHARSSLRADIGRKLFEEEQQRHTKEAPGLGKTHSFGEELGGGERRGGSLGSSIDLIRGYHELSTN